MKINHKVDINKKREFEYPSKDELIVALWEMVVENKPESANKLQILREQTKLKVPKNT